MLVIKMRCSRRKALVRVDSHRRTTRLREICHSVDATFTVGGILGSWSSALYSSILWMVT
jgi:hypothetical protein